MPVPPPVVAGLAFAGAEAGGGGGGRGRGDLQRVQLGVGVVCQGIDRVGGRVLVHGGGIIQGVRRIVHVADVDHHRGGVGPAVAVGDRVGEAVRARVGRIGRVVVSGAPAGDRGR